MIVSEYVNILKQVIKATPEDGMSKQVIKNVKNMIVQFDKNPIF